MKQSSTDNTNNSSNNNISDSRQLQSYNIVKENIYTNNISSSDDSSIDSINNFNARTRRSFINNDLSSNNRKKSSNNNNNKDTSRSISNSNNESGRSISYRNGGFPKFPLNEAYSAGPNFSGHRLTFRDCGQRNIFHDLEKKKLKPSGRIIGGSAVPYGAYPWTVRN